MRHFPTLAAPAALTGAANLDKPPGRRGSPALAA